MRIHSKYRKISPTFNLGGRLTKLKISINGYGTIGKRIAEAIIRHPFLTLVGVGKYTPDHKSLLACEKGLPLFAPKKVMKQFSDKGIKVRGSIEEMVKLSDVIIDCSTAGKGFRNKGLYASYGKKAVFQGGEPKGIAELSFNSRSNFNEALGKRYIRIVSCNTTALCRMIKPIMENYELKSVEAILLRRSSDPGDDKGGLVNSILWSSSPSHHGEDVKSVLGEFQISTSAFTVPHTLAHLIHLTFSFNEETPTKEEVRLLFKNEARVCVLESASSTSQIVEAARDLGLRRYDTYAVHLLMNTFHGDYDKISFSIVVPQESIVIPENIDALVAQSNLMEKQETQKLTERILGIDLIKEQMEKIFRT